MWFLKNALLFVNSSCLGYPVPVVINNSYSALKSIWNVNTLNFYCKILKI